MHPAPTLSLRNVAFAALLLCFIAVARVSASTFPGLAPCASTLQACIDAAGAGDTIELASNLPIDETVTVRKSLSLQPANGVAAQLRGIEIYADDEDVTVSVSALAIGGDGLVSGVDGAGNLDLRLIGNTFVAGQRGAISLSSGKGPVSGAATVLIAGNAIRQTEASLGVPIFLLRAPGGLLATITDNDIALLASTVQAGIQLICPGGGDADAVIARNRIHGANYHSGIEIENAGPGGRFKADVFNNLITGQGISNVAGGGAIALYAHGQAAGIDARIINNTLVAGQVGIGIDLDAAAGASIGGSLVNNIIARQSTSAVAVYRNAAPAFGNANNLFFGNAQDTGALFVAGPRTRYGDPLFRDVASGDYSLLPRSDAIDRGDSNAAPPGTDLAHDPRVQGLAVDLGALESPFTLAAPALPVLDGFTLLVLFGSLLVIGSLAQSRRSSTTVAWLP